MNYYSVYNTMCNINKINQIYKKKIQKIFNIFYSYLKCNIQITIVYKKGYQIKIKSKNLENIEFINKTIIQIQVFKNNYTTTIYCNNMQNNTINNCINYIKNSIFYTSPDKDYILTKSSLYNQKYELDLGIYFSTNLTVNTILNTIYNIEYNTLYTNINLISNDYTSFSNITNNIYIYNNYQYCKYYNISNYILVNSVIAKQNQIWVNNYDYIYSHNINDMFYRAYTLGKTNAINTLKKLNPKNIHTQKNNIILKNTISIQLFEYFIQAINGYNIYYKKSFLINKLYKKVLPQWINIINDPYIYKGIGSKPFDNEGNNTYKYNIVTNGILNTWITDTYTSLKLNIPNTNNNGGIDNLCFHYTKPYITYEMLIQKIKNGFIIDQLLGEGVNLITGNLSKGASGFYVENGVIKYPVNEITISGNLKDMFNNIIDISNDTNINSAIQIGSLLISNVQITGKK